jgi:hypothetical protein
MDQKTEIELALKKILFPQINQSNEKTRPVYSRYIVRENKHKG